MSKTRANNEGNIKLRADGRYEVRVTVDYDKMTGKPKRVSKYAKTREEAVKLLNQMSFMNDTSPNNFTRVTKMSLTQDNILFLSGVVIITLGQLANKMNSNALLVLPLMIAAGVSFLLQGDYLLPFLFF